MNRTIFLIKRQYKKATDSLLGVEGKIDLALISYDETIANLGEAITACELANLTDKVKGLEQKVLDIYSKKQELLKRKTEILAKVKELEAMKQAAIACSKVCVGSDSADVLMTEVDNYIKQLEAELKTVDFISRLK